MPALYSDFRSQRTLNPDGFHANITAWRDALARATREGRISSDASTADLFILSVNDHLLRSLEYKQYGRPIALGSVVKEAVSEKQFFPLDEFLRSRESIYSRSWTAVPKSVVSWAFQQLWSSDSAKGDEGLPQGRFVVLKNVEAGAKALAEYASTSASPFDRTFTKSHFYKTFCKNLMGGHRISHRDLDVLLKYASRDRNIIAYDGKTIRLRGDVTNPDRSSITEEDAAISSLKELMDDIKSQVAAMETRIEDLTSKAKECVARNNKISALSLLKSRKLTETALEKRHATLTQLEEVAHKIQQAANQVQLVEVMEASTGILRSLNQQVGGVDRVEEAVDKLREQMEEVDELGNVLASAGTAAVVIDEAELDSELAEMEAAQKPQMEQAQGASVAEGAKDAADLERRLDQIPAVPSVIQQGGIAHEAQEAALGERAGSPTDDVLQRTAGLQLEGK